MKNGLSDLNNYLFEQIERLNDDECDLEKEIKKSAAIIGISEQVMQIGKLQLEAMKVCGEYGYDNNNMSELLMNKRQPKAIGVNHG